MDARDLDRHTRALRAAKPKAAPKPAKLALTFSIHDAAGVRVAAAAYAEDAAAFSMLLGDGSTVQVRGRELWKQGSEDEHASDSYGDAGALILDRLLGRT